MRVVGGSARGRALKSVPGETTRPILDRVKTALFDILRPQLQQKTFLDLFAGSGSVGIEALSQGAKHATFTDIAPLAVKTIKENLAATNLSSQAEVRQNDAFSFLRNSNKEFDLIFIAPPQYKGLWLEAVKTLAERPQRLSEGGLAIVQIDPVEYEKFESPMLHEEDLRKYGNTNLLFYRKLLP